MAKATKVRPRMPYNEFSPTKGSGYFMNTGFCRISHQHPLQPYVLLHAFLLHARIIICLKFAVFHPWEVIRKKNLQ